MVPYMKSDGHWPPEGTVGSILAEFTGPHVDGLEIIYNAHGVANNHHMDGCVMNHISDPHSV